MRLQRNGQQIKIKKGQERGEYNHKLLITSNLYPTKANVFYWHISILPQLTSSALIKDYRTKHDIYLPLFLLKQVEKASQKFRIYFTFQLQSLLEALGNSKETR